MELTDVAETFNRFTDKIVSQIVFIHDYFEMNMQENGLTFLSETFIRTDSGEYQIPSKDGNWYFYQLIGKEIIEIRENEKNIIVSFNNGWKITVDTCLEPPGDNFRMSAPGCVPIFI